MSLTGPATSGRSSAPPAPGRLGAPLDPQAAAVYLDALGRWRDERKSELDELDQGALTSRDGAQLTADIALSMALWKSISDRHELLSATWNSGRAGRADLERMATLIWGRLDTGLRAGNVEAGRPADFEQASSGEASTGLAVSLPEACRLSDALVSQLRVRLGLDPSGAAVTEQIRRLRAQMERIRDQINLEPAGASQQAAAEQQSRLARRLKDIADKAGRGGEVGGLLGPLEIEAATFERDLIVAAARRRQAVGKVDQARRQRADLQAREAALTNLVEQCVAGVDPAPNYAIPDVEALGAPPNTAEQLDGYLRRLDQVARAMAVAQQAYTRALHDRDELRGRLTAYHAKARAMGVATVPEIARAYETADNELGRQPTRMPLAAQLVKLYSTYLQTAAPAGRISTANPTLESS
jgi:hypothetical protein